MSVDSVEFIDNTHLDRLLYKGEEIPVINHSPILKICKDGRSLKIELTEDQLDRLYDALQEYYFS